MGEEGGEVDELKSKKRKLDVDSKQKKVIVDNGDDFVDDASIPKANTDVNTLYKAIPIQYGIKGDCNIRVMDSRHILIRLNQLENYVHLLSIVAYHIKVNDMYWQMPTLKWDPWFEPNVETTIDIAWISMLDLPPNFFAKEAIFSIVSAGGKPLMVDIATKNNTRPSCVRIKIEVDLLAKLPNRVKINEEDDISGKIKSKWIKIQYDHNPKYCKECCLQGHDEASYWNIHSEMYEKIQGQRECKENNKEEEKGIEQGQ
ncbi:hypothetical protein FXO38_19147 [Capsicum annuum]|nr:hypothetical protein FXO37_22140 [Capsicum annuum]KAF3646465.1 hypothetical protein FXO38_19147 [Capsicum annuum]